MAANNPRLWRAAAVAAGCLLVGLPSPRLGAGTVVSASFSYDGTEGTDGTVQTWVVPAGVTRVTVVAEGAAGGRNGYQSVGGLGARVTGKIDVTPGEVLRIRVGGRPAFNNPAGLGGYNGGGAPGVQGLPETIIPGGGGGASDVRRGGGTPRYRVIVAGGGGGAGAPASQDAQSEALPGSGGGGGGLYGGGSGASGPCEFAPDDDYVGGAGGGGGGSSLVPPGGTLIDGYGSGPGRVTIRYQLP